MRILGHFKTISYLKYSVRRISSTCIKQMEAKIKVSNNEVNYLKVGNGPRNILCMPGALGTIWTDFKPQIEGIDRQKFTLVVWDPPGYGKSRPPSKQFPVDFYEKDADVAAEMMKVLNIPKYSVLGWSDGGITGLILASKYPEAMDKLVIWGANSFILPTEIETYEKIKDIQTWSPKMRQPMIDVYGEAEFAQLWSDWVQGMMNLYKEKKGDICNDALKKIQCATFILHGEKDPMVENVHVSNLHTSIENSSVHLYPEGKHNIHLRYAEDFNKRVQQFILA